MCSVVQTLSFQKRGWFTRKKKCAPLEIPKLFTIFYANVLSFPNLSLKLLIRVSMNYNEKIFDMYISQYFLSLPWFQRIVPLFKSRGMKAEERMGAQAQPNTARVPKGNCKTTGEIFWNKNATKLKKKGTTTATTRWMMIMWRRRSTLLSNECNACSHSRDLLPPSHCHIFPLFCYSICWEFGIQE